jgi:hypothetical protein
MELRAGPKPDFPRRSSETPRLIALLFVLVGAILLLLGWKMTQPGNVQGAVDTESTERQQSANPVSADPQAAADVAAEIPLSALRQLCVAEIKDTGSASACREYEIRTRYERDPEIQVIPSSVSGSKPAPLAPTKRADTVRPSRDWLQAVERYCDALPRGSIQYRQCRAHDARQWIKTRCEGFDRALETTYGAYRQQLWADRTSACSAAEKFQPVN